MIAKYFSRLSAILIASLLLSSCMKDADDVDYDKSKDPQIHTFSISSKADTLRSLNQSPFSIDQVNGRIFNKEPLPYQFHVDSVKLNLVGSTGYNAGLSKITLHLRDKDTTYVWNGKDSVDINRLHSITTVAANGSQTKTYAFEYNVHQQDPFAIQWERVSSNYLGTTNIADAKTLHFNGKFVTFYKSASTVWMASSPDNDGKTWANSAVASMPATIDLSSICVLNNVLYASNQGQMYKSTDGLTWNKTNNTISVRAIYGSFARAINEGVLVVVLHNGELTYAQTTDFETYHFMNAWNQTLPISGFSALPVANENVYSADFILLAGGKLADGSANPFVWLLQKQNGEIQPLDNAVSMSLAGSTVFNYDGMQYLIASSNNKNSLYHSDNYGMNWSLAGVQQAFPDNFTYRQSPSVWVDDDNYIWIFGGYTASHQPLVDVWRGRLNKLAE